MQTKLWLSNRPNDQFCTFLTRDMCLHVHWMYTNTNLMLGYSLKSPHRCYFISIFVFGHIMNASITLRGDRLIFGLYCTTRNNAPN